MDRRFRIWRGSALITLLLLLIFAAGAQAQDTAACQAGFRLVTHTMGETCVPENPQRVVALEWTYVEDLLSVGVQPVGIADIQGYHDWVRVPVALDGQVVDVGDRSEPNLEAIAALNPDLIIGVHFRLTENYDDLSAIAPTLVFNPYPADLSVSQYEEMTTTFTTIAAAVNREAEGQAVLAHMQDTYAQAQAALEAAGRGGEPFILSQGWTYDSVATFRLFTDNAMAVQILEQIGLQNAWDDAPQLYGFTEIGIEGFADLQNTDFNFFYVAQDSDNDFFAESPLWSSMAFVQSGRAYWIGGDVWLFGGPLSAELLVDTMLQAMGVELPAAQVAGASAACDDGFRSVEDATGAAVCVPANPQRVMALMESDLDALLALGVQPIGTTNGRGQPTPPRYLADYLDGVEVVGNFYAPNLESVLTLQPDLILMGGFSDENVLAQLNAIAPTVNTFMLGETWQSHFRRVAEVMNLQPQAEAFLTDYDARVQALAAALGENAEGVVSIVRWNPDGPGIMLRNAFSSRVVADLGLQRPASLQGEGVGHTPPLSFEDLGQIDADWIFIGTLATEGDAVNVMQQAIDSPLFQQLGAVRSNHVVFIDGSLWTSIGGPLAATKVLDDVQAAMADPALIAPEAGS